ncbi:MEKHLA domain-containing protein [Moritella marina ATCC 15381]|uniref:MEKHLA domain-containing protein n=1 Tax=Moritella marina ATCC 15381 TaxID=1202962 RepID=A0A5J6WHS9_MORMI|nr:MEKHLA domain-containing protein [Moritella marina ATCC 15381]
MLRPFLCHYVMKELYRGLRISASGCTFWIENAIFWNLIDNNGSFAVKLLSLNHRLAK